MDNGGYGDDTRWSVMGENGDDSGDDTINGDSGNDTRGHVMSIMGGDGDDT